jgi:hypothetical protein
LVDLKWSVYIADIGKALGAEQLLGESEGATQALGPFGRRTDVVSGGPSAARAAGVPTRRAPAASESVAAGIA